MIQNKDFLGTKIPDNTKKDMLNIGTIQVSSEKGERIESVPTADTVVPDANQYEYQKQELAAFVHFGPNTFNEIEWGENYGSKTPDEIFPLKNDFDGDTLVKTLKEAGFQKMIVTAKHHDGFCIWDSAYTDYDVASTSYRDANGNSDILENISMACTKYDMDMGLYLSPWDIHDASYGYYDENGEATTAEKDVLDYNEYYNNQLIEILSSKKYGNNGRFKEVWMDGAKGSGANAQEYDFEKWFHTIQQYQGKAAGYEADCLLFGAGAYTTVRWIGNESGYSNIETWAKSNVNYEKNFIDSNPVATGITGINGVTKGWEQGNKWTVPEADARITSGWFWGTKKNTPKTLEALGNMYFETVGRNSVLLLNIPPNNQGTVDEAILNRVKEFGNAVKKTFETNLAKDAVITASEVRKNEPAYQPSNVLDGRDSTYWTVEDKTTTASLDIRLDGVKTFDVVSMEEAILFGQRITCYKIEYCISGSDWMLFEEGTTIGAKRLSRKPAVEADRLRITISTESDTNEAAGVPILSNVGIYKAAEGFSLKASSDIDDGNISMVGLEKANYTMEEDSEIQVKIIRKGGSGKVKVTLSPNPGSAIQDDFDTECITTVTFNEGETQTYAPVRTKRNTNVTGDQYFTIELSTQDKNVVLGGNSVATVIIKDADK